MTWQLNKLGAEPKKIGILVALVAVAGYFYFTSSGSNETPTASKSPAAVADQQSAAASTPAQKAALRPILRTKARQPGMNKAAREFRPSVRSKDPIDPQSVDPGLHLGRLALLQDIKMEAGSRSLFEILTTPPVDPKIIKEPDKIKPVYVAFNRPEKPKPPEPPKPPPPPPAAPKIPLKFYGWVNRDKAGPRKAFFLDGEDIIIAAEGELIKKRYKVLKIGVNSATVEDTEFKTNAQQQLPLETEQTG